MMVSAAKCLSLSVEPPDLKWPVPPGGRCPEEETKRPQMSGARSPLGGEQTSDEMMIGYVEFYQDESSQP